MDTGRLVNYTPQHNRGFGKDSSRLVWGLAPSSTQETSFRSLSYFLGSVKDPTIDSKKKSGPYMAAPWTEGPASLGEGSLQLPSSCGYRAPGTEMLSENTQHATDCRVCVHPRQIVCSCGTVSWQVYRLAQVYRSAEPFLQGPHSTGSPQPAASFSTTSLSIF